MAGLLTVGAAMTSVYIVAESQLNTPLTFAIDDDVFLVSEGQGLNAIATTLEERGLISSARWLRVGIQLRSSDLVPKKGEYRLVPGESVAQLLQRIHNNAVIRYALTVPEGVTFEWFLNQLWQHPRVTRVLDGVADPQLSALLGDYDSPEGLFLPETYLIQSGDTDLDILRRARDAMKQVVASAWMERAEDIPLASPYEALILASIIEKETGIGSERDIIAGVFSRRLKQGMRLQTDPTIIYGLGSQFDGNLTRRHLQDRDNKYNTYRIAGLPPTPISLPGKKAIEAALRPAAGASLYFVAKGDGSHAFSDSLSEHKKNVRRYQLQRREDYRSSPR